MPQNSSLKEQIISTIKTYRLELIVFCAGCFVLCAIFSICKLFDDSVPDEVLILPEKEIVPQDYNDPLELQKPEDAVEYQAEDNVFFKDEAYIEESVEEEPVTQNLASPEAEKFLIAIVIDDMGINQENTAEIINLSGKITASFLTYGQNLQEFTDRAKANDKEIIAHIAMEPHAANNTAPDQLCVEMDNDTIKKNLEVILDHFGPNLIGGNNHMGSKFTENPEKMAVVMEVLQNRRMFFLDSKTSNKAIGCMVAEKYGVNCVNRDVFLDNENDFEYITGQLHQTEKIAQQKGYAVAIGHPKTQTVAALKKWLDQLDNKQFELVHLSDIIKKIKNK